MSRKILESILDFFHKSYYSIYFFFLNIFLVYSSSSSSFFEKHFSLNYIHFGSQKILKVHFPFLSLILEFLISSRPFEFNSKYYYYHYYIHYTIQSFNFASSKWLAATCSYSYLPFQAIIALNDISNPAKDKNLLVSNERKLKRGKERKKASSPHGISVDRKGNRISRGEQSSMNPRVSRRHKRGHVLICCRLETLWFFCVFCVGWCRRKWLVTPADTRERVHYGGSRHTKTKKRLAFSSSRSRDRDPRRENGEFSVRGKCEIM